jgi:fusion and transport protein UGO1
MSSSREGPNPLRPYYIPPSIGIPQGPAATNAATSSGPRPSTNNNGTAPTYASSARDIFSDIDYSEYVSESSQSTLDTIRELLDQALYKYMSVLLAQPFENAKTILQVRTQAAGDGTIPVQSSRDFSESRSRYQDSIYADVSCFNSMHQILC